MAENIVDYIKSNLSLIPRETIIKNLLKSGWAQNQIDAAFNYIDSQSVNKASFPPFEIPFNPPSPQISSAQSGSELPHKQAVGFTKSIISNGLIYPIMILMSFIVFAFFTKKYWGDSLNILLHTGGVCSAQAICPVGAVFGIQLQILVYIFSWLMISAAPGVLFASILRNTKSTAFKFLLIASLPNLFLHFYSVFFASPTTSAVLKMSKPTLFLRPFISFSPYSLFDFLSFSVLPYHMLLLALILGLTLLILAYIKFEALRNVIFKIEVAIFIIFITIQIITPKVLPSVRTQIAEPTGKLPKGKLFYQTSTYDENRRETKDLFVLDESGKSQKIDLGKNCLTVIPSPDQTKFYCDDNNEQFIVEAKNKKAESINIEYKLKPADIWSWSGDSKYLLFVPQSLAATDYHGKTLDPQKVYLLNTADMTVSELFKSAESVYYASFSPNNENVAIIADVEQARRALVTLNVGSREAKLVSDVSDCNQTDEHTQILKIGFSACYFQGVQWAKNGDKLFYYSERREGSKMVGYDLTLANIGDLSKKKINVSTDGGSFSKSIFDGGDDFFFTEKQSFKNNADQLTKVKLSTGESIQLPNPGVFDFYFSNDGRWIIYSSVGQTTTMEIWLKEVEGDQKIRLLNEQVKLLGSIRSPNYIYWFY